MDKLEIKNNSKFTNNGNDIKINELSVDGTSIYRNNQHGTIIKNFTSTATVEQKAQVEIEGRLL